MGFPPKISNRNEMSSVCSSGSGISAPCGAGRRQGIYWMLTVPHADYVPYLPPGCAWIRGQLELGASGFLHWQILVSFAKKVSLVAVRSVFGNAHAELSRSAAAADYVWKEETRVAGTQFELGEQAFNRNKKRDWDAIWASAIAGDLLSVPAPVRVQSYRTLRAIGADFAEPVGMVRSCQVFWGRSGSGKSRDAWAAAEDGCYSKDPRSKFWCGYRGQTCVVLDEFRGGIDVAHMLRWLDRYPVCVEVKGSSVPLCATRFWITSNIHPDAWYPDLDVETLAALKRRMHITHYV